MKPQLEINMDEPTLYFNNKIGTPNELLLRFSRHKVERMLYSERDAEKILSAHCNFLMHRFYTKYHLHIPNSKMKLIELAEWKDAESVFKNIDSLVKPTSHFLRLSNEEQSEILCIDSNDVKIMLSLISVKVKWELMKKYWELLPNGIKEKDNAYEFFKEINARYINL